MFFLSMRDFIILQKISHLLLERFIFKIVISHVDKSFIQLRRLRHIEKIRSHCEVQWRRADIGSVRKPCDSDAFARKNIQIWHILHFMVFLSLFYLRTASALYSSVSDDFRISMRLTPSCLIIYILRVCLKLQKKK